MIKCFETDIFFLIVSKFFLHGMWKDCSNKFTVALTLFTHDNELGKLLFLFSVPDSIKAYFQVNRFFKRSLTLLNLVIFCHSKWEWIHNNMHWGVSQQCGCNSQYEEHFFKKNWGSVWIANGMSRILVLQSQVCVEYLTVCTLLGKLCACVIIMWHSEMWTVPY